jgi:hypothetical protein
VCFLRWRHILLLRTYERPNFIALETADAKMAHIAVMELSRRAAKITEQVQDGMLRHASHAASGVYRDAFYKSGNDLDALFCGQTVHNGLTERMYNNNMQMSINY